MIRTISATDLCTVMGGRNTDSTTKVGDGTLFDRQVKTRSDDAYRLDMIKQACDRQATTTQKGWFGNTDTVDQAKAASCFLQQTQPKP